MITVKIMVDVVSIFLAGLLSKLLGSDHPEIASARTNLHPCKIIHPFRGFSREIWR